MKKIMEDREEHVTWENFKVRFMEEYFPDSVRYAKEIEDRNMPKYEDRKKPYFIPQSYSSGITNSQSPPNFKVLDVETMLFAIELCLKGSRSSLLMCVLYLGLIA